MLRKRMVTRIVLVALSGGLAIASSAAGAIRPHTGSQPVATAASTHSHGVLTGPGYTSPTTGSGTRVRGGTVNVAEWAGSAPNSIFPMVSAEFCTTPNIEMLQRVLYEPLYTYGNNYSVKVDYNASIGEKPIVSNGDRTYTIRLKNSRWSDGERVSATDLVFWMNMLKASPGTEWCDYVPGMIPDNVKSYRAIGMSTFQLTFKRPYNPTWVLYNELSQLFPLPLAWDRTSLAQKSPRAFSGSIGSTVQGAGKVWTFLSQQSKQISNWASSPIWRVVDGPFRLAGMSATGQVTLTPNPGYSGSPKPSIAKLVEVPFTSDAAMFNQVRSGGTKALTVAYLPEADAPQAGSVQDEGYTLNRASSNTVSFVVLNFNNPRIGPVVRQLYFRQALQRLVDQRGWISAILHGTASPTYGPVPSALADPFLTSRGGTDPYPFSVPAARSLLARHGWKVVPGGSSSCVRPGTGAGDCGRGITKGETIAFTMNYTTGSVSEASEMENLQSMLRQVGINMTLESHQFNTVVGDDVLCTPKQAACSWQGLNWDAGWSYQQTLPTGEFLFRTGSTALSNSYSDPEMNRLIEDVITASPGAFSKAMARIVAYAQREAPAVFVPTSVGTFVPSAGTLVSKKLGGYTANTAGTLEPQYWYLTK